MPGRPIIYSGVQIGPEVTPATAVAANIKLLSTTVMPVPEAPSEEVTATGQRADTDVIVGKHSSRVEISGKANATDLMYWFASALGPAVLDGNAATMQLDQDSASSVSYTLEYGDGSNICKLAGARVVSLNVGLSPNAAPTFSGSLVAQNFVETGSMTASPTEQGKVHFGPRKVAVFVHTTTAGLTDNSNKLSDDELLAFDFGIDSLADPVFGIEDTESWAFITDSKPSIGANMSLVRGAKARTYYTAMLAHTQYYARILMTEGTSTLDIRFPFKFTSPGGSDQQGQYCADYRLSANYDGASGLGTALKVVFTSGWVGDADPDLLPSTVGEAVAP
jgi:hypothetical protein